MNIAWPHNRTIPCHVRTNNLSTMDFDDTLGSTPVLNSFTHKSGKNSHTLHAQPIDLRCIEKTYFNSNLHCMWYIRESETIVRNSINFFQMLCMDCIKHNVLAHETDLHSCCPVAMGYVCMGIALCSINTCWDTTNAVHWLKLLSLKVFGVANVRASMAQWCLWGRGFMACI